jgi:hypothetical protein
MLDLTTKSHERSDKSADLSGLYVLGAGGLNSRIEVHSSDASATSSLRLSPFHSVYCLDLNSETGDLAAGTKGGFVIIIEAIHGSMNFKSRNIIKINQGAPILSICWASNDVLAVSDATGRCLLWHYRSNPAISHQLPTIDGPICALLRLDENTVVALSAGGRLQFWNPNTCELKHSMQAPKPPPTSALVQMKYWTAKNAIVFPDDRGNLFQVILPTYKANSLHLKNGPFYAFACLNEYLFCMAFSNSNLTVFSNKSSKMVNSFELPEGAISMFIIESSPASALFVGQSGRLFRCLIDHSGVEFIGYLSGDSFRSIAGPDAKTVSLLHSEKMQQEAEAIISQLNDTSNQIRDQDRNAYLRQLERLGFKHIVLALEADRTECNGDIVDSLKYRKELINLLPQDDPLINLSFLKYVNNLEASWHISDAYSCLMKVFQSAPDLVDTSRLHKLRHLSNRIEEGDKWIIEPDVPIESIIEASTVLEKIFEGRYVLRRFNSINCGPYNISSDQIAEKYNKIQDEKKQKFRPIVETDKCWLISKMDSILFHIVRFFFKHSEELKDIHLLLVVSNTDLNTVISPVSIFDWRSDNSQSYLDANEKARHQLETIRSQTESDYILSSALQNAELAIRRILTTLTSIEKLTS